MCAASIANKHTKQSFIHTRYMRYSFRRDHSSWLGNASSSQKYDIITAQAFATRLSFISNVLLSSTQSMHTLLQPGKKYRTCVRLLSYLFRVFCVNKKKTYKTLLICKFIQCTTLFQKVKLQKSIYFSIFQTKVTIVFFCYSCFVQISGWEPWTTSVLIRLSTKCSCKVDKESALVQFLQYN